MVVSLEKVLLEKLADAQFFMLRYETEFTPCTGITAVTKMERRHFNNGIMISPWCPNMKGNQPVDGQIRKDIVKDTGWSFTLKDRSCKVFSTTDEFLTILFLQIDGCFQGVEDPYNVPGDAELHSDVFFYSLGVQKILKTIGRADQFVWGADWETVPALYLARKQHLTVLTLHNTFDKCLEKDSPQFGSTFKIFHSRRRNSTMGRTALEIGLTIADVVTTVNRGFAYGMRNEVIQTRIMANHLQNLLPRVVGIDNAAFSDPSDLAIDIKKEKNLKKRRALLFTGRSDARASLPVELKELIGDKVLVVSMGRRVSQKQHDVVVEAARQILSKDKQAPVFFFFPTKNGDGTSKKRLDRIEQLQEDHSKNVYSLDGDCPYYKTLMQAADYNCMPSLYEPHGGAYEGTVVPIARAIDGLAEQICGLDPKGDAVRMNNLWHTEKESPTGILFREEPAVDESRLVSDLKGLLDSQPTEKSVLFAEMVAGLKSTLLDAIELRLNHSDQYADMVFAALQKQESWTWEQNLDAVFALVEKARSARELKKHPSK